MGKRKKRHAEGGRLKIRINTKLLTKRITSTHSRTAKTAKRTFRSVLEVFITFRRGDPCLQAGEEAPPPFEFLLNRFFSFPADAASCS